METPNRLTNNTVAHPTSLREAAFSYAGEGFDVPTSQGRLSSALTLRRAPGFNARTPRGRFAAPA
jgi:hypothetical protein